METLSSRTMLSAARKTRPIFPAATSTEVLKYWFPRSASPQIDC